MNNLLKLLCVFLVVIGFSYSSDVSGQWRDDCGGTGVVDDNTNEGREFLLCYMQNELVTDADINETYQDIYLASLDDVEDSNGKVTITITCNAFPTYKEIIQLSKRSSLTYHISRVLNQFVLIYSNEVVDDMVVQVASTHPIICYGMNHKKNTADAFLALPKNVAGDEYMVMSYPNSAFLQDGGPRESEFCVAAFEDNTKVDIIPSTLTKAGSLAGATISYTLNAGQCVQVQASDIVGSDLTGSRVHSYNKPVVVYGGHVRAEVPVGFKIDAAGSTSRDHLCESLPHVGSWGTSFLCTNIENPNVIDGDFVRILARNPNTVVKVNGVVSGTPLGIGEHRDMQITGPTAIETSQPSLVGLFAHTTMISQGVGDPFFAIVSPLDQTYDDFTFFVSEAAVYNNNNYVVVVTEKSGVGKVTLDGNIIPEIAFNNIPTTLNGKNYAIARVNVAVGTHRVKTPNNYKDGITVLAYGYGSVDSYGYTAGSLLVPKKGIIADDSPFAGVAPGGEAPRSEMRFMSMLNEKVWLDSAVMTSISNPRYTVRTKKHLAFDISKIEGGEKMAVELEAFPPADEVLFGEMTIYHHTTKWRGLRPAVVPFVVYPNTTSGITNNTTGDNSVVVFPNPIIGETGSVLLRIERSTSAALRLYDATGRQVRSVAPRQLNAGKENLSFPTEGLASGSYILEVELSGLNRTERRHIIIQK